MTQPGETSNPDTVSFGNARESQPERERPVVQPKPPAESGRPAEPVGGSSGPAMDLTRRALVAVAFFTVIALVVAVVALVRSGDSDPTSLLATETHGLTEDQAACLRFSLVESRFTATRPNRTPEYGLSSAWSRALDAEISGLDAIATNYPAAHYRIVVAINEIADASAVVVSGNIRQGFSDPLAERADLIASARDVCSDVASFDTERLVPTD